MHEVSVPELTSNDPLLKPPLKVLWVHNTARDGAMFLWDVLDALPSRVTVEEVVVPLRPPLRSLLSWVSQIRSAARSADVVHAQFGSLVGMLASFTGRPQIVSLRGTDFYILPSQSLVARAESEMRRFFTYVACCRADLIIVMSERMRRELRQWPFLKRKRVIVLTDPIGAEFIPHYHGDGVREVLKRTEEFKVLVGSLSSTNPVKRTWLVKQAVSLCSSVGLPVVCKIVSGIPRTAVKKEMEESDIVALMSTHEGWPNIVKEGQACGLPFISTDVSDLSDLCGRDTCNRIVEPDELDVALALVEAVARREFRQPNSHLFPEAVGIKHEIVYQCLVGNKVS